MFRFVWFAILCIQARAFTTTTGPHRIRSSSVVLQQSFADGLLEKLSNFGQSEEEESASTFLPSPPFQPTPEGVIQRAKLVLASDLGVGDESLLDTDFVWIGSNLGSKVLGKTDYLAAGKFFDLRAAFPDLDYRAHDYRIDENDPFTVRVTLRTVGTMRGELRLRNDVLPPNGKQMRCPPEAISMTFDKRTGRMVKLCSGFAMDRFVGNTGGVTGVMAAATVAGSPPSDWEIYPASTVLQRFFGRPTQPLGEVASFLAPFPETVMIQLAKGIFAADMSAADPDLLSPSFSYFGQFEGPIGKEEYLEKYASKIFNGLDPNMSYLRVDPYDPYRVWVDVQPSGTTVDNVSVDGPPQAFSFTFDDDGFCTRLTANAVMDPSIGNTGGLGGYEGIKYAEGNASPGIFTRPLPQVLGRLRKAVLSVFTKIGVDDYVLTPPKEPIPPSAPTPVTKLKSSPVAKLPVVPRPVSKAAPAAEAPVKKPVAPRPSISLPKFGSAPKAPTEKAPTTPKRPSISLQFPSVSQPATMTGDSPAVKAQAAAQKAREQAAKKAEAQAAAKKKQAEALRAQQEKRAQAIKAKAEKEAAIRQAAEEKAQAAKARAEEQAAAKRAQAEALAEARARAAEEKAQAARARAEEQAAAKKAQAEALAAKKEARAREAQEKAQALRATVEEKAAAKKAQAEALAAQREARARAAEEKAQAAKARAEEQAAAQRAKAEALAAQQEARARAAEEKAQAAKARAEEQAASKRAKAEALAAQQEARARAAKEKAQAAKARAEEQAAAKQAKAEALAAQKEARARAAEEKAQAARAKREEQEAARRAKAKAQAEEKKRKAEAAARAAEQKAQKAQAAAAKKAEAAKAGAKTSARPTLSLFGGPAPVKPEAAKPKPAAAPRPSISLFGGGEAAKPKPTPTSAPRPSLSIFGSSPPPAPKAESKPPAPRRTIALFGGGGGTPAKTPPAKKQPTPKKKSTAPKGVPSLARWRKNRDKSVTGYITGSNQFDEGEKVTTSPIASGAFSSGNVVTTSSGSRYFLE